MEKDFIHHIEEKINLRILSLTQLYGGCINQAFKIKTQHRNYFIKINSDIDLLTVEEKGLSKLKSTNTFHIPEIMICSEFKKTYYLIMEFIEADNKKDNFWSFFGQKLASLHKNFEEKFGLEYNNYIGSLPQNNTFTSNPIDFFITYRILPQVKILQERLSINLSSDFKKLFKLLPNIIPLEKPSLIHGDLWNGNYLTNNKGEPTLIDPSIYYGSREVDIAMTKLFAGFPKEFYVSYNLDFPLKENWEERIDIWNLYPLLVHANLFGDSYIRQIQSILKKFN